jgi:hypothetical protein
MEKKTRNNTKERKGIGWDAQKLSSCLFLHTP